MTVYFYTLGCKVNQYETQQITEAFLRRGYLPVLSPSGADVIVINSCTVTAESVRKTRQNVRHFKKSAPGAILILTGCAVQADPQIANDLPEVDILLGNRSAEAVADAAEKFRKDGQKTSSLVPHLPGDPLKESGITHFDGHTRAFLKIQDGCDRRCSYCMIPAARGFSRSKSLEDIDRELSSLNENVYHEVVFVGINLSDFGRHTGISLPDALKLAEKYDGIRRVRLGSLEPDYITPEMIGRLKQLKKLCPQFHISVQSGSDSVLKAMNRHYTVAEYEELVRLLRASFFDAAITTDIIVGFPTETEADFAETLTLAERAAFEKVHIFPYSKRAGTPAATLLQLTNAKKAERAAALKDVTEKTHAAFLDRQIGQTVEVLFEADHEGFSEGYTPNYTQVKVCDGVLRQGLLLPVKLALREGEYCVGTVLQ